jgi:hypothetical protein
VVPFHQLQDLTVQQQHQQPAYLTELSLVHNQPQHKHHLVAQHPLVQQEVLDQRQHPGQRAHLLHRLLTHMQVVPLDRQRRQQRQACKVQPQLPQVAAVEARAHTHQEHFLLHMQHHLSSVGLLRHQVLLERKDVHNRQYQELLRAPGVQAHLTLQLVQQE